MPNRARLVFSSLRIVGAFKNIVNGVIARELFNHLGEAQHLPR